MTHSLPAPAVMSRYLDDGATPALPANALDWGSAGRQERLWELPEGVNLVGPPPSRFACKVERVADDLFSVHLMWDRTRMTWPGLRRVQVLTSALVPLLKAIGVDPATLLDQPVRGSAGRLHNVA